MEATHPSKIAPMELLIVLLMNACLFMSAVYFRSDFIFFQC